MVSNQEVPHLKRVSRIKHHILQKYFFPWQTILGSANPELYYVDCFAGPGIYESEGKLVHGSPLIAVRSAKGFLARNPQRRMKLIFVERDPDQVADLDSALDVFRPFGSNLSVTILPGDVADLADDLAGRVPRNAPAFFLVDPYGHPLPIPFMRDLLARPKTELLVNFMYYRINMDASNPLVQHHVDALFGDRGWRDQPFMEQAGRNREHGMLRLVVDQLSSRYPRLFRICFDQEDGMSPDRTKYYLIHATNHILGALLIKEAMWGLGDEEGTYEYSGSGRIRMFPQTPSLDDLSDELVRQFRGHAVTFDEIREVTWNLPYLEKHYRTVIKQLATNGLASWTPVTSKTARGLSGKDLVQFAKERK